MPFAEGVPTVDITLGGKPLTIGWTWGAKRRVRDHHIAKYANPQDAPEEENLATILWAGMDKEVRASLSVEDIEDLIHPRNEAEVAKKIRELIAKSEPDPEPEVKAEPAAVKTPTAGSSNSSKSGQLASTI